MGLKIKILKFHGIHPRVRLNIQAFAVSSTFLSVSNRLQDLSLPDVTRIDSDFKCAGGLAKFREERFLLSLHERAERET